MKTRFFDLLGSVDRLGMGQLIEYIETKTDFVMAPASTKYHGACEQGLLVHSLAVYDCFLKITETFKIEVHPDTAIIACLMHDLCKANFYTVSTRNAKNEQGVWEKVPYYTVDDKIPLGHGEKSVILLQAFIRPTIDEIMAIRWHMGAYGGDYETNMARSAAMDRYPIVGALHTADLAACYFEKK